MLSFALAGRHPARRLDLTRFAPAPGERLNQALILISTPAGKFNLLRRSTVFLVGWLK